MKNISLVLISLSSLTAYAGEELTLSNIQVSNAEAKVINLRQEKKITRALFLPELSLKGGWGSEKILDISPDTEKGPFLFLDSKLNLYRGGRDSNLLNQTEKELTIAKLETEIKKREIRIEAFQKISEINLIEKENALIKAEIEQNQIQRKMAKKKVDAGLTTNVDMLDFDLKEELLQNDLDKNNSRSEILVKELLAVFGNKSNLEELKNSFSENLVIDHSARNGEITALPQIMVAKKKWEISSLRKKSARAEYIPTIDLEAKYGQITPQKKLFGEDKEHQLALTVTLPLFSGFSTSGKYQQSIVESSQSEKEFHQEQIDLEAKKDIELKKIAQLNKTLTSLEKLLERSNRYSELTIGDYRRGVKNSPDVIAASDKKFEVAKRLLETRLELLNLTYSFNEIFKNYSGE